MSLRLFIYILLLKSTSRKRKIRKSTKNACKQGARHQSCFSFNARHLLLLLSAHRFLSLIVIKIFYLYSAPQKHFKNKKNTKKHKKCKQAWTYPAELIAVQFTSFNVAAFGSQLFESNCHEEFLFI